MSGQTQKPSAVDCASRLGLPELLLPRVGRNLTGPFGIGHNDLRELCCIKVVQIGSHCRTEADQKCLTDGVVAQSNLLSSTAAIDPKP